MLRSASRPMAVVFLLAFGWNAPPATAQTNNYFTGTGGSTLTGSNWSTNAAGPYSSALVTTGGAIINFGNANTTIGGGSITVAGINATANATISSPSGTLSTFNNGVIPVNVAAGVTLALGSQSITSSGTAGFTFDGNGTGIFSLAGNTYGGGFTLTSGTVILGGVNALGVGVLTINGGTIATTGTRDLSNKPSSIVVGNDFAFGTAAAAAGITFNAPVSLGAASRKITLGGTGIYVLSGIISASSATTGLTVANASSTASTLTLSGANTYTGGTTINGGSTVGTTINVGGNQSAANGGWVIAPLSGDNTAGNTRTVNFNTGSTVAVAAGKTFQLGYTSATGQASTLNVAGTVNSDGQLNVQRSAVFNVNSGGAWTQTGGMLLAAPSGSGINTTMTVASGGSFTYNNANTSLIQVSPANAAAGTTTLTISGTFTTNQGFTNTVTTTNGTGATITLNGGTLALTANVPVLTQTAGSAFTFAMGTGGGTINTNAFSVTMNRVISGATGLTKTGSGTLTLGAVNTYAGNTTITAGTLLLDTGASTASTSAVSVSGTLAGTGTVNGATTVASGGTVRAGSAATPAGTLNSASDVTLGAGSILGVTVAAAGLPYDNVNFGSSTAAGVTNNLLAATGAVGLPSGLTVAIDGTGAGFVDGTTYSYKVAQAGSVNSALTSPTDINFQPTGFAVSSYSLNTDATGVYVTFTAVVPEPGTVLGLSAAGLALLARFRRRIAP